jgi:hypothetical protein
MATFASAGVSDRDAQETLAEGDIPEEPLSDAAT